LLRSSVRWAGAGLALCSIGFGAITTFVVLAFNARHSGGASFAFTYA
jgi:hypothetical protein